METITTSHYTLKVMNPFTNKKALHFLKNYIKWKKDSTIWTIYGKPCYENEKAFCKLRQEMRDDNGIDLRCGNQSCHSWSLAYRIPGYVDSLGVILTEYLIYHTRDNVYAILIDRRS